MKTNNNYYAFDSDGNKIAITESNFPKSVKEYGVRETLLAVTYYVSNGTFPTRVEYNDECRQEIKLAIGDKGW